MRSMFARLQRPVSKQNGASRATAKIALPDRIGKGAGRCEPSARLRWDTETGPSIGDFFETRFLLTDICDGGSEVEAGLFQSS